MQISSGIDNRESTIYELIAIVYGSNESCTKEVMTYAKKHSPKELKKIHDIHMDRINYLRQVGDIY